MAASITKYQTANGTRWRVRYRKPNGAQTDKRGFKTKSDAQLWQSKNAIDKATGNYIDPTRSNITINDLAPQWLETKQATIKVSSYLPLEAAWRNHVEPTFGKTPVRKVTPANIQTWVNKLTKKLSPSAVSRVHSVLAGMLDVAVKDNRIPANPARDVSLPKRRSKPKTYLTHQQVQLLAGLSAHPEFVLFLAYTGLRFGEAVALNISDVNLERKRVTVSKNIVYIGTQPHPGTTKTDQVRTVPYPLFLHAHIKHETKRAKTEPLFTNSHGTRHGRPHFERGWFQTAVEQAQQVDKDFPRVTPHDLRHAAASFAIESGAHVKAVQRMLGHASAAMTLDVYADLFDDDLDSVAEKMASKRSTVLK